MLPRIDLDHVAVASRTAETMARTLIGEFGAEFDDGGAFGVMRAIQVRFPTPAGSVKVELIEPPPLAGGFLEDFLSRRGPGVHHLTFRTDDIHQVVEDIRCSGTEPTGLQLDGPLQREAFIRPRDGFGIVIQVVQKPDIDRLEPSLAEWYRNAKRPWWRPLPEPRMPSMTIHTLVMRVRDLGSACDLYTGPLGGVVVGHDDDSVTVRWPSVSVRLLRALPEGFSHLVVDPAPAGRAACEMALCPVDAASRSAQHQESGSSS